MEKQENLTVEHTKEKVDLVPIKLIHESPWQGRFLESKTYQIGTADTNRIKELVHSIEQSGLMQPVILRQIENGYEIIDGHRRIMAYKMLKRTHIEAIVRKMDNREAQVQSIIGNLQRKNLNTIETAIAYKKVLDAAIFKDAKELSKTIGKDETLVNDTLNLLKLDKRIIDDLAKHTTIKDVRMLRSIRHADPVDKQGVSDDQFELYQRVVNEKLSREDLKKIMNGEKKEQHQESFSLSNKASTLKVVINTKKYNKEKRQMLEKMVNEKIQEIIKMFSD